VFAIGGINASNLASLTQYGADRIAVSSSVWQHTSPEAAMKELFRELLDADASNL
jgi:thiamine monophosphate synthase